MHVTATSRRIKDSIIAFSKGDYESTALHYFSALDRTAKKRYPKISKVGSRIVKFLNDEEELITFIAYRNVLKVGSYGGYSLGQFIYKYGRCSIMHDGELDKRLSFDSKGAIVIGEKWQLDKNFLFALMVCLVLAPENSKENIEEHITLNILGNDYILNEIWGQKEEIIKQPPFNRVFKMN